MGLLANCLCHFVTSQHVCCWRCRSWNSVKENQFRNVKVQTVMVALVQKTKTSEAEMHAWVQVMICLSKGQFVTRKLETVLLPLHSRPIPGELAIKLTTHNVNDVVLKKFHYKGKLVFYRKMDGFDKFGDRYVYVMLGLW